MGIQHTVDVFMGRRSSNTRKVEGERSGNGQVESVGDLKVHLEADPALLGCRRKDGWIRWDRVNVNTVKK